jgi:hypothetical protein
MPIKRLLSGRNFTPDGMKVITWVFELAQQRLRITADDEAAKLELAKLVLSIAAP